MDNFKAEDLNNSFDSSVQLDELSLTQTTNSLVEVPRGVPYQNQLFVFSPMSTPRSKSQTKKQIMFDDVFIGFKNGCGKKEILINKSKMKKAKQFFDDSQIDFDFNQFSVGNTLNFHPKQNSNSFEQEQQFSMPCFKTVGSGAQVKISDSTRQQVNNLFREFQSIKKPTKMKKKSKFITQSMVKTYNVESKFKPENTDINRHSFNLQQYEKQYKQQIEQQIKHQTKHSKRITQAKRQQSKFQAIVQQFLFIRLYSLTLSHKEQLICSSKLDQQYQSIDDATFQHEGSLCKIIHCVLCKIKYQSKQIQVKGLYQIFNEQFSKKWITLEQFIEYYHCVCFKLIKYSLYWPSIINKSYHLSNILIEINKKSLLVEKENEVSFLKYCISKDQIGRRINLIIKRKTVNSKMKIVFIHLSDGWSTIWAAIQEKNLLYSYVKDNKKVRVGTKLALSLWNFHPISNILQFCSEANNKSQRCIQLFYNGSIILQPNAKLGYIKQQFYRPLNKCRAKGGFIPVVQGTIVRIFSIKQSKKLKSDQPLLSTHYTQLLTPQGFTILIKFLLNEQSSLVEYFRLYHYYRLYKLKINQDCILAFMMNQSKYDQINLYKISQRQKVYPKNVIQLLRKRLLNTRRKHQEWNDGCYDVLCSGGKVKMGCGQSYEVELQGDNLTDSMSVYQQINITKISNKLIRIRKMKDSSQLRKIPKIYQSLLQ